MCYLNADPDISPIYLTVDAAKSTEFSLICNLCNLNQVEDTLHFIFNCPLYENQRNELFTRASLVIPEWENMSDTNKLRKLFTELPRCLGRFVKNSYTQRRKIIYK